MHRARLMILDSSAASLALKEKLILQGFECKHCLDTREALALLDHEGFDLIVADGRFARLNERNLLNQARTQNPAAALLIAAPATSPRMESQVIQLGVAGYLTKPFRYEDCT